MFYPAGALSALSSGAVKGMEQGFDFANQMADIKAEQLLGAQAQQLFASSLGSLGGWAPPAMGGLPGLGGLGGGQAPQGAPGPSQAAPGPSQVPAGQPTQLATMGGDPGDPGLGGRPTPPPAAQVANRFPTPNAFGGPIPPWNNPAQAAQMQPMTGQPPPMRGGAMPGAQPVRTTPQPPSPEAQQRLQSSAATPAEMIDAIKNGMGWMSIPELATRIETANPNASPLVKFKALQMGAKLLNAGGQQQLSQMLQWFREDRAEKREKRLEEQWLQSDKERQERLQIAEEKQDPVYQRYKKSSVDLSFKAEQTKAFTSSMEAHVEQLAKLSEKAGVTGQMDLDGFFNAVAAKFGSDTANQYRLQYAETAGEIGKLLSGGMGNAALTEGVRNEAHRVMPEGVVIPAHTLRAMAKTMKANANARYKAYTDRVIAQDKSYKKYKETGVYDYSQEELEGDDSAAPPATAPTIAPPKGVTITPIGQ